MPDSKTKHADQLAEQLAAIAAFDVNAVPIAERSNAIGFDEGKGTVTRLIEICDFAHSLPWAELPEALLMEANSVATQTLTKLGQIAGFNQSEHPKPASVRDAWLQELAEHQNQLFRHLVPITPFLTMRSIDLDDARLRAKEITQTKSDLDSIVRRATEQMNTLSGILHAAQQTVGEVGAMEFAGIFGESAGRNDDSARVWLRATAILGVGTVLLACCFAWIAIYGKAETSVTQGVAKLVVVSLFYIAAVWASKMFRALRHLAVVDRHRRNALLTFKTFVESASNEDPQVKNAILLEASRCIFAPSATGYLGPDADTSSNRIVEILRTFGSKSE